LSFPNNEVVLFSVILLPKTEVVLLSFVLSKIEVFFSFLLFPNIDAFSLLLTSLSFFWNNEVLLLSILFPNKEKELLSLLIVLILPKRD
jgi:hypothetical protein